MHDLAGRGWYVATVDLRGHGDSEWAPDGDYQLEAFAEDVIGDRRALRPPCPRRRLARRHASLAAAGDVRRSELARALVLVDVAPNIEAARGHAHRQLHAANIDAGSLDLDEIADALQGTTRTGPPVEPRRPAQERPPTADGRWYWHWDPAFVSGRLGSEDETRAFADDVSYAPRRPRGCRPHR